MRAKLGAKHGRNSSPEDYAQVLENREEFNTAGHMKGRAGAPESFGRLDEAWRESVQAADYVVYSYFTPIAWHTAEGWVVPARGTLGNNAESQTTTTGMNKIRTALSLFTEYKEKMNSDLS